jgi:hypothetical protein
MKTRKNIRKLIQEYNSALPADKPNTALMKLKKAILDLKNPAIRPSVIPAAQADGALSRYDDFVWAHHDVMMQGPNGMFGPGPNWAHRGPAFGPWHRELLKLYEQELQSVSGDPNLTLPYWNWTKDQAVADPGFPFFADFLGPDGAGNVSDKVTVGAFAQANGGWNLNVDEENFGFLRRHFGIDGPGLPTAASVRTALGITPYDSDPWNQTIAGADSFRNTLEGWVGNRQIHNSVHRWVNGSMQPGTSPNDPVFFFHHCNIDRLWAVWQQKHPAEPGYLPDMTTPPTNGATRVNERMASFGRTAGDIPFGVNATPGDVLNSKAIVWYDSDLPELSNETGSTLSFVNIPEGLTSYKAVKFKVTTGRPVHFRITGVPSGNFGLTSMGTEFVANPDDQAPFVYGYVWVQLTAVAGPIANSSVDIHAYIIDEEGYYAANEFDEFPLGDFHVGLTATTVARENNAVALVLDRSGSMATPAGGTSTRSTLLKNAVSVFNTLMLPNDEIALVSFDDQIATPVSMQAVNGAPVAATLAGTDLDPRGATWIGGGIQEGATQLTLATHTNKSMVVLTDGNENVHPYVGELPAGTITDRTYAIGFGLPGDVSDAVLNQITSNTHGDLIITGNISTAEQGFNLTKYFVQVLAGVTRMNVLLDPQGSLFFGSKHVIPFELTEADVYADIIALCPLPQILDFFLETPGGTLIKPAGAHPNIRYVNGQQVLFYRMTLPALAGDPAGSHVGTWKAILALKKRTDVDRLLKNREFVAALGRSAIGDSLPYSLVAHVYSNLQFEVERQQNSLAPGALVTLRAALKEYDVPLAGDATVWVEITSPDLTTFTQMLAREATGVYVTAFKAASAGIYSCRVRAEGYSSFKNKFTREKTLTASTYVGDYTVVPPDGTSAICELLRCLTSEKVLSPRGIERLEALGIDAKALRDCVRKECAPHPGERRVGAAMTKTPKRTRSKPSAEPRLTIKKERAATPVKVVAVRPKSEDQLEAMPAATRIVHMFGPPTPANQIVTAKGKASARKRSRRTVK